MDIINEFIRYLELERELGTRSFEIDRSLLKPAAETASSPKIAPPAPPPVPPPAPERALPKSATYQDKPPAREYKYVFLHDAPLSPAAISMMAKILVALKTDESQTPIVFCGERPSAKVYVVLGAKALKKWFPGSVGAPGQWIQSDGCNQVLVTYSPEYFLRFGENSPTVLPLKRNMWNSLKTIASRVD